MEQGKKYSSSGDRDGGGCTTANQGTDGSQIGLGTDTNMRIYKQIANTTTGADGKITQYNLTRASMFNVNDSHDGAQTTKNYAPYTLTIRKPGYKQYGPAKLVVGSTTPDAPSYKTDCNDLTIQLENRRFVEQRSIANR